MTREEEKSLRAAARAIIAAALEAADPGTAVERALGADLSAIAGRLVLVAVGKASGGMTRAALRIIGPRLSAGILVQPRGYPTPFDGVPADLAARISVYESSHPVPDEQGVVAARAVMALIGGMGPEDRCLFLLSGGGSSLLPLPHAGITLEEKRRTTELLLRSGAGIAEMNVVRKHLSAIKGGRLAAACRGTIRTLAISDVVGDDPGSIASGPTVADPSTFADARSVLERHGLLDSVPDPVLRLLEQGMAGTVAETPKTIPPRHSCAVIASNRIALEAAAREARARGFSPEVLTNELVGEAREAGRSVVSAARNARGPVCLLAGGETTVTVRGKGTGGRNQEIALAAALDLEGQGGVLVASFATDGKEGNSSSAGAYADGGTVGRGRDAGLDPRACLDANDSGSFLAAAGDLIVTGPTGTNVNDLTFALVAPR